MKSRRAILLNRQSAGPEAVARKAWVEAHAALARRAREQPADQANIDTARQRLTQQWPDFLTMALTPEPAARAAEFADVFALRAHDSVQLASAHLLHQAQQEQILYGCFDRRLNRAVATLGLARLE